MKRAPFVGRRLVVAAQQGAAAEAEEVIEDMRAAGLAPGPRAYHGLIFSHAKARHTVTQVQPYQPAAAFGLQTGWGKRIPPSSLQTIRLQSASSITRLLGHMRRSVHE